MKRPRVQTENLQFLMTPREQQVAALLIEGAEVSEIGERLGIHVRTVKAHLHMLYVRAGIESGVKRVRLVNLLSSAERKPLPNLTNREKQIAELVLKGYSSPAVSALTGITVQMVKNYLRVVYDKCGVWSRTELAARYRCD